MGTLVAMHYPTVPFLGTADHTYVMCSTGRKAWGCWGGKTGGSFLRSGSGSTNHADAIAEPNEHAGVTCYLVNGVCHQAANRILFPAGILVTGARGYAVSSAIYGPYGRPRGPLGKCKAPFNRHVGVTGDLPQCLVTPLGTMAEEATRSPEERKYLERVSAAYSEVGPLALQGEGQKDTDLVEFMVQLFDYQIEYSLGDNLDKQRVSQLLDLRAVAEKSRIQIENEWAERKMGVSEFVVMSDLQAILFQKDAARALTSNQYEALFGLNRGEFVALADPGIVATAYRQQELY